jgi:hypothetical protein
VYVSVLWNNLTLADSNKLENVQIKFYNLCCKRFIQPNSFCNYESMLNCQHLINLYSWRQNLDALLLSNVFKNKIDCCSVMDTVGLLAPCKQIRDFTTFNVSNVSRLTLQQGASRLQITPANFWTFSINLTSPLRINFSLINVLNYVIIALPVLFYCLLLNFSLVLQSDSKLLLG